MTDAERIDLACKVLAIANEARVLAMKHGRFTTRDWSTIDIYAEQAKHTGSCVANAIALRGRATWHRQLAEAERGHGLMVAAAYTSAMADLFDRAAALHEESAPAT